MRYATWRLNWEPDEHYGSGPEPVISVRGGSAEGVFYTAGVHDPIVGYVYGDISLSELDKWNFVEITAAEALTLAQQQNAEATLDAEGRILFPFSDLIYT